MELNLAKTVVGYLKAHPDEKFTARQIAEWVFATYPDQCQAKKQSSQRLETDADLLQQIVAEIGSQRLRMQTKHPELKTTEGRPRKYYYSERSDSAEVAAVESEGAASMTDASTLKIDEHVSNSSWANFGYLVAAEIGGTDTLKELRMLFAAHGIGFIKLDVDNPAESQVLIPARERDEIDWDMANRLAIENKDFLEYVKLVKQFYQTGEARPADWDVSETGD
ncbi:MAG: HrgA protein [Rhodobacterales bacterium]|nr:HrgA protein [Rhodobacterales bacterium]